MLDEVQGLLVNAFDNAMVTIEPEAFHLERRIGTRVIQPTSLNVARHRLEFVFGDWVPRLPPPMDDGRELEGLVVVSLGSLSARATRLRLLSGSRRCKVDCYRGMDDSLCPVLVALATRCAAAWPLPRGFIHGREKNGRDKRV